MGNSIVIIEYIGLAGFIIWSLVERGFSLLQQQQEEGKKQSQSSYWLINIAWYGAMFFAILDVWMLSITTFNELYWPVRGVGVILILGGLALRFLARRDLGNNIACMWQLQRNINW